MDPGRNEHDEAQQEVARSGSRRPSVRFGTHMSYVTLTREEVQLYSLCSGEIRHWTVGSRIKIEAVLPLLVVVRCMKCGLHAWNARAITDSGGSRASVYDYWT